MRLRCAFLPLIVALTLLMTLSAARAQIAVGVSIGIGPPPLPVYVQPLIPGPRYVWAPGYWAWDPSADDYYWVPGTWVLAPEVGLLWTPGYWGWRDDVYIWNAGYWGPRVGFYGGINYGCGYTGAGFYGGYWHGGVFMYNRAVTNLGTVQITNVYNKTVINNTTVSNVSFNGGKGGIIAHPTAQEQAAALDKHIPPTEMQTKHQTAASTNHALFASVNKGNPTIAATSTAGRFSGAGIVAAKAVTSLPRALNAVKASSGPPGSKQFTARKSIDPAAAKALSAAKTVSGPPRHDPLVQHTLQGSNQFNARKTVDPAAGRRLSAQRNFSGPPGPRPMQKAATMKGPPPGPRPPARQVKQHDPHTK